MKDFERSQSSKIDSIFGSLIVSRPSCVRHDSVLHFHSKLLVHYSIHDYRNDSTASRMRSLYALHLSLSVAIPAIQ
ncbi:MAG: hypothetical protein KZQ66_04020, partial [Candidatus Thiodiazotropha sp. (ex Lucinoma aequizonata)]|nr:hypothetical protein [Candidatus Thiodiazotropha sp. (ex Lucinoma aequizonata)]MCU7893863.1 hypothetical protein [Candidatus Thiodiazotropha sp. (ex Lucinoma aequizonata)]MCU7898662.1 hypothetical protein [Candidatus Thiodiazotropha sp. (ex Lucinoma aequizonata)]MCU7901268.1 hypothetical protein [Candidatus Thiodiazotropha sp. (ex Lucinoma aequizonata)]MCU7909955.1 hypothetical protein [Candidatus Thiodiazotropha sp. (ex Lucinoma aequizonata)]